MTQWKWGGVAQDVSAKTKPFELRSYLRPREVDARNMPPIRANTEVAMMAPPMGAHALSPDTPTITAAAIPEIPNPKAIHCPRLVWRCRLPCSFSFHLMARSAYSGSMFLYSRRKLGGGKGPWYATVCVTERAPVPRDSSPSARSPSLTCDRSSVSTGALGSPAAGSLCRGSSAMPRALKGMPHLLGYLLRVPLALFQIGLSRLEVRVDRYERGRHPIREQRNPLEALEDILTEELQKRLGAANFHMPNLFHLFLRDRLDLPRRLSHRRSARQQRRCQLREVWADG